MKKATIISIGNELLSGQTVDTNASWLSDNLFSIGIPVVSGYTVGDDIDRIKHALEMSISDAEMVFITGGLGPTKDDLTRDALAKTLNVELQLDEASLNHISEFFKKRTLKMPETNTIQAYIPQGAKPILNALGTAPGIRAESKGKLIFAMPGVPAEMKKMFLDSILPDVKNITKKSRQLCYAVKKLKCFGAGESAIAELIGDYMKRERNPLINSTVHHGITTLHIIAAAKDKKTAQKLVKDDQNNLRDILKEYVFGTDEQTLAEVVAEKLIAQNKTIATAESCTGGLLAKLLTDIPGASVYFIGGWITYSNKAKVEQLSVPPELIERFGAVSEEVAAEMATQAAKKAKADYAIGITGIAGPTGGTEQKPVGLVYISVSAQNQCDVKRLIFPSDRDSIRIRTANTALNLLRLKL